MGDLMRRYWIPALLSSEIAEPDCPPVRLKLLGEQLIAFRDSRGRVGVMDEFCAYRGVSLWFGRNEESGLRCPYHGWKYDVTGQCVEVPSEPVGSGFCKKIKLACYECIERGAPRESSCLKRRASMMPPAIHLSPRRGSRPPRCEGNSSSFRR